MGEASQAAYAVRPPKPHTRLGSDAQRAKLVPLEVIPARMPRVYSFTEDTGLENSNLIGEPGGIGWSQVAVAALRIVLELSWEKCLVAGAVIAEALPFSAQGHRTRNSPRPFHKRLLVRMLSQTMGHTIASQGYSSCQPQIRQ